MVIRMNGRLAAHLSPGHFDGPIRYHLVGVHVGLRPRPRLPNPQWEVTIQHARNHLIGGPANQLRLIRRELAEVAIDHASRLFKDSKGANHLARHDLIANIKMQQRPGRLRPPVHPSRHLDHAHTVAFLANRQFCHNELLRNKE